MAYYIMSSINTLLTALMDKDKNYTDNEKYAKSLLGFIRIFKVQHLTQFEY